jgi:cysteine desulfurase
MGAALAIARAEMKTESARVLRLRERLRSAVCGNLEDVSVNGTLAERLPGNLNLSFSYVEGESLLLGLKGIAVSSGSACTSASLEPSHVLRAIGVSDAMSHSAIRFGLGRGTTEDEIDYVAERVIDEVLRLRRLSPAARKKTDGAPRPGTLQGEDASELTAALKETGR